MIRFGFVMLALCLSKFSLASSGSLQIKNNSLGSDSLFLNAETGSLNEAETCYPYLHKYMDSSDLELDPVALVPNFVSFYLLLPCCVFSSVFSSEISAQDKEMDGEKLENRERVRARQIQIKKQFNRKMKRKNINFPRRGFRREHCGKLMRSGK